MSSKTKWKRMLPYAKKYDVEPRGYSPFEIFQTIISKDRKRKIEIEEEDLDEMMDIVDLSPEHFDLKKRYKHFFRSGEDEKPSVEKLEMFRSRGLSYQEIGKKVGMNGGNVWKMLNQEG